MKIITDELILTLEYYHDNPEYIELLNSKKYFYDIYNKKIFNFDISTSSPEKQSTNFPSEDSSMPEQ